MANMHTSAFLYSKIPNPSKSNTKKRSTIISDSAEIDEYGINTRSTKASLTNKSIGTSLIATLGQRKRDVKSLNVHPFKKTNPNKTDDNNIDESPRISTEQVRSLFIYVYRLSLPKVATNILIL